MTDIPTVKRCPKCGETKPLEGFHRSRRNRDGLRTYCKECHCDDARAYRCANRKKVLELQRLNYEAHREEYRAYRETHREERNAYNRAYRETHREEHLAYNRERYALIGTSHIDRCQEISRKHATRLREPWSEAEDRYLTTSTERAVDDALALGRTYRAVVQRVGCLRKRGVTLARDAHRR